MRSTHSRGHPPRQYSPSITLVTGVHQGFGSSSVDDVKLIESCGASDRGAGLRGVLPQSDFSCGELCDGNQEDQRRRSRRSTARGSSPRYRTYHLQHPTPRNSATGGEDLVTQQLSAKVGGEMAEAPPHFASARIRRMRPPPAEGGERPQRCRLDADASEPRRPARPQL